MTKKCLKNMCINSRKRKLLEGEPKENELNHRYLKQGQILELSHMVQNQNRQIRFQNKKVILNNFQTIEYLWETNNCQFTV
jgi:hypothetical protein